MIKLVQIVKPRLMQERFPFVVTLFLSLLEAALYVADKLGVESLILQIKGTLGTQFQLGFTHVHTCSQRRIRSHQV